MNNYTSKMNTVVEKSIAYRPSLGRAGIGKDPKSSRRRPQTDHVRPISGRRSADKDGVRSLSSSHAEDIDSSSFPSSQPLSGLPTASFP
ncbi:hypothetical protein HO173_006925 [Letharia columbiana]|uniref:Uncharacterized protein n=1 Tax=Letharia columbiana TaxID=112416 RepID=A0A8H6L476_9LECA|nr:uncharacterized protein HO173_006925 [Letharia columbiana]KAF6234995.1 hypothetical protein HO173_006925 [Letharia columbiana]